MKLHHIKWKLKQFPNLIVRLVTFDRCYICDECHRIHKRKETDIRFDDESDIGRLMSNRWWYGAVCRKGYEHVMNEAAKALRDGIRRTLNN
jgi:hypothetical protein